MKETSYPYFNGVSNKEILLKMGLLQKTTAIAYSHRKKSSTSEFKLSHYLRHMPAWSFLDREQLVSLKVVMNLPPLNKDDNFNYCLKKFYSFLLQENFSIYIRSGRQKYKKLKKNDLENVHFLKYSSTHEDVIRAELISLDKVPYEFRIVEYFALLSMCRILKKHCHSALVLPDEYLDLFSEEKDLKKEELYHLGDSYPIRSIRSLTIKNEFFSFNIRPHSDCDLDKFRNFVENLFAVINRQDQEEALLMFLTVILNENAELGWYLYSLTMKKYLDKVSDIFERMRVLKLASLILNGNTKQRLIEKLDFSGYAFLTDIELDSIQVAYLHLPTSLVKLKMHGDWGLIKKFVENTKDRILPNLEYLEICHIPTARELNKSADLLSISNYRKLKKIVLRLNAERVIIINNKKLENIYCELDASHLIVGNCPELNDLNLMIGDYYFSSINIQIIDCLKLTWLRVASRVVLISEKNSSRLWNINTEVCLEIRNCPNVDIQKLAKYLEMDLTSDGKLLRKPTVERSRREISSIVALGEINTIEINPQNEISPVAVPVLDLTPVSHLPDEYDEDLSVDKDGKFVFSIPEDDDAFEEEEDDGGNPIEKLIISVEGLKEAFLLDIGDEDKTYFHAEDRAEFNARVDLKTNEVVRNLVEMGVEPPRLSFSPQPVTVAEDKAVTLLPNVESPIQFIEVPIFVQSFQKHTPISGVWRKRFLSDHSWVHSCKNLEEFFTTALTWDQPLIHFDQSIHAFQIHRAFKNYAARKNMAYMFIGVVDDLLTKFNEKFKGILLIDWTYFSTADKEYYKRLAIKQDIKILGLLAKGQVLSSIFSSRCDVFEFPVHLKKELVISNNSFPCKWFSILSEFPKELVNSDIMIANLYASADVWYEELVEKFDLREKTFSLKAGKLITAMSLGKPLYIVNPPASHDLSVFLHHFIVSGGNLTFDNKPVFLHPNFKLFYVRNQNNSLLTFPNSIDPLIKFYNRIPSAVKGKIYIVNGDNFNSCFTMPYIDETSRCHSRPGLFEICTSDDAIIFNDKEFKIDERLKAQIVDHFAEIFKNRGISTTINLFFPYPNFQYISPLVSSFFVMTLDPQFSGRQYCAKMNIPTANIWYPGSMSIWEQAIEWTYDKDIAISNNSEVKRETISYEFPYHRQELTLLQKVTAGEKVVVCGGLTEKNYSAFQTAFEGGYFIINSERLEITGTIIWIHPPQKYCPLPQRRVVHPIKMSDYKKQLRDEVKEVDEEIINNIILFWNYIKNNNLLFQYAQSEELEETIPRIKGKIFAYSQFKRMYLDAQQPSRDNPIKSILNFFSKKTEEYARINVISKIIFSKNPQPYLRVQKLGKIFDRISNQADFKNQLWAIANCFNGHAIRSCFGFEQDSLAEKVLELNITDFVDSLVRMIDKAWPSYEKLNWFKEMVRKLNSRITFRDTVIPHLELPRGPDKPEYLLIKAITEQKNIPSFSMINIIGPIGSGKTYTAERIPLLLKQYHGSNCCLFSGENSIPSWLSTAITPGCYQILVLDDLDEEVSEKFDFLRGFFNNPPVVYYQNQVYHISPEYLSQYTVVTIQRVENSQDNPQFHSIVFENGINVYLPTLVNWYAESIILKYLYTFTSLNESLRSEISDFLLSCYCYLIDYRLTTRPITVWRDFNNICAAISFRLQKCSNLKTLAQIVAMVAREVYDEVENILSQGSSPLFVEFLQKKVGELPPTPPPINISNKIVLTENTRRIYSLIERAVAICIARDLSGNAEYGKQILVISGATGTGKSSLLVAALQQILEQYETESSTQIILSTLQLIATDTSGTLIHQFIAKGGCLILDDINHDFDHKSLKHALKQTKKDKSGLRVCGLFSSMTPNNQIDGIHKPLSSALLSRAHEIKIPEPTKDGLLELAQAFRCEDPVAMVQDFIDLKADKNFNINMWTFFRAAKKYQRVTPADENSATVTAHV